MPRPPRLDLSGLTLHVVQRGNNRQACFQHNRDYLYYLHCLGELLASADCQLHSYVLMTNHVHLMLTPQRGGAVSSLMQCLGGRYVRYANLSLARTGTLWEGRFKSCPVDSSNYALACMRYIELNPVRAGMVSRPEEYRWSSFHGNALGRTDPLITLHPAMQELAITPEGRNERYRQLACDGLADEELNAIRLHAERQRAWGGERFTAELEAKFKQPVKIGKRGRPRKIVTV